MIDQETLGASLAYTNKALEALKNVVHYLGVTTTTLSDGATTNPIMIDDKSVTAVNGDMVFYNGTAYTWDGTEWQETLSIAQIITQIETITEEIGNLSNLTTEEKSNLVGAINEIVAGIPKNLSDLQDDATHRLVTDTEKSMWNEISFKTATGNPITLTDAANANAEKLLMTIEPIQSGSGDPSPTNVRPISGLTEASASAYGNNLSSKLAMSTDATGAISASDGKFYTAIEANKSYVLLFNLKTKMNSAVQSNRKLSLYLNDNELLYQWTDVNAIGVQKITITPTASGFLNLWAGSGAFVANTQVIDDIYLADVEQSHTATITFGQTVYGGSVNFKTGEVTVTHAVVDMSTLPFNYTGALFYVLLDDIGAKRANETIEGLKASIYYNGGIRGVATIAEYMIASNIDRYFYINDPRANTVAELVELISGQTLCYELATPTTLSLTPAELELLKGNNTITANGAEISIEYYPDNAIGALAGRVDDVQEQITGLDTRVTALEEAGGGVSNFEQIGETASGTVSSGTFNAMMHKSNIANYSEFMFVAYCEDDSVAVPAPIILSQMLAQRVIDNSNSFSVTNGTITFTIKPQASFPVNHVVAELSGITTTDKRYYIEFYGRAI